MALDCYAGIRVVPRPYFYRHCSFNSGSDENVSFESGTVLEYDVLLIAHEPWPLWKMFVRMLKIPFAVIGQIEANESEVSEKCFSKCSCLVFVVIMG